MNIHARKEMVTTWQRVIGDSLFRFEHYVNPGKESATYVYRRVFDSWTPDGRWDHERVIRLYADSFC